MENKKYRTSRRSANRIIRSLFILILLLCLINHPYPVLADTKGAFVVNSMTDLAGSNDAAPGNGICASSAGDCTLRAAIQETNALQGADTIQFDASVTMVIVQTALPALTDTTGGTTISGGSGYVYILGSLTSSGTNGFTVTSNNNKIQGLDIAGFPGNGIVINGDNNIIGVDGDGVNDAAEHNIIREQGQNGILINTTGENNRIAGNKIGIDRNDVAKANTLNGIQIGGSNNLVGVLGNGTSDDLEGNLISRNKQDGIYITNNDNVISGNQILTNEKNGVTVFGSIENRIGTDGNGAYDSLEGNRISGNFIYGIEIYQAQITVVAGNLIGTNPAGDARHANVIGGLYIWDANHNIIGSDGQGLGAGAEGNLISGNNNNAIKLYNANGNTIAGNKIGTNQAGTAALYNSGGIFLDRSGSNIIGTNGDGVGDALEGNLISGNNHNGISVSGAGSIYNVIAGNKIGVTADGLAVLPNGDNGVILAPNGNTNRLGTNADGISDQLERNIISGNGYCGVQINGSQNLVAGNTIGANATGLAALPNQHYGICIYDGSANSIGSNGDGVGDALEGNLISGNAFGGIHLGTTGADTSANTVYGNKIGTTASGTSALPNLGPGVFLEKVNDNRIGFPTPLLGNIIAYHSAAGIAFSSPINLVGNRFQGNSMFANSFGIDLGFNNITYNDSGDSDIGPNGLLNFPILLGAETTGDTISVAVSYNSKASKTYVLEFYWSRTCNASGYGEGEKYLDWGSITTDASGNGLKQIGLNVSLNQPGFITATATDSDGSTSEFSQCIALEGVVVEDFYTYIPLLVR